MAARAMSAQRQIQEADRVERESGFLAPGLPRPRGCDAQRTDRPLHATLSARHAHEKSTLATSIVPRERRIARAAARGYAQVMEVQMPALGAQEPAQLRFLVPLAGFVRPQDAHLDRAHSNLRGAFPARRWPAVRCLVTSVVKAAPHARRIRRVFPTDYRVPPPRFEQTGNTPNHRH